MGNWLFPPPPPPPPMVLVPPIFDFPPLADRTRMSVPAYDVLFGKMALNCLFQDYFENAKHFEAKIMIKPMADSHVDLVAAISGHVRCEKEGNAVFRWQRDLHNPHTFIEISASTSEQMLLLKSCTYHPRSGFGVFGRLPLLMEKRTNAHDYGMIGLRYGSESISIGTTLAPFSMHGDFPINIWAVRRAGKLSVGVQYKSDAFGSELANSNNWNWAIGYGLASTSPLLPLFNFGLEFARGSQMVASFYQHIVVQRRVKNPFELNQVVGITNYIDLGFELNRRFNRNESQNLDKSSFQLVASWQANKNILLKGKLGPSISSFVFAFKSWWKPSFTFSISVVNDRTSGKTSYGFGIRVEDLRDASYERADPNYVMLTPSKDHLADGVLENWGTRPMYQADADSGNHDRLPPHLRPMGNII